MELGMYSVELKRDSVEQLFAAMRGYGFSEVQFDYLSVCDEEMPLSISGELTARILAAAKANGVKIVSVNGTFNMIDPDINARREGILRFRELARHMSELECSFVTLCTGSRSPEGMWRMHPDSVSDAAWADLLETMAEVLAIAEEYDLQLGLETEPNNAMNSPERCRALIDHFGSPRLKVIMDIANLFRPGMAREDNVRPVMKNAFELLGADIGLAHGKDILAGEGVACTYAGNGIVDFEYFRQLLAEAGYTGGLIIHGLHDEAEFPMAVGFIRSIFG